MHDCKYTENTISFFLNYESFRVIGFNSGFYLFRQIFTVAEKGAFIESCLQTTVFLATTRTNTSGNSI